MKLQIHLTGILKLSLIILIIISGYNNLSASVSIDSVKTTISRCPNSGTISVFASTNQPPVLYSITSGPETRPYQSDAFFSGLFPGTYEISVTNITGEVKTQTVIIKGSNYVEPDFAPTSKEPTCYGGSDGQIIGHPVLLNSRKPFTWVLTNTQTNVITTQSSDTFNNLKAAEYTLRMHDSCQNFVTRTVFINNDDTIFKQSYYTPAITKIGCDTMRLDCSFFSSNQNYTGMYKLTMYHSGITIVKFLSAKLLMTNFPNTGINWYGVIDTFPNLTYDTDFSFTIEDNCGRKINSKQTKIPSFVFTVSQWYAQKINCNNIERTGALLDLYSHVITNFNDNFYLTPKFPLTMTVKDVDSNNIVQVSTIHNGLLNITPKVGGRNYLITITDSCGSTYSFDTIFPNLQNPPRGDYYTQPACLDSTGRIILRIYGFGPGVNLEILSGPKYLHSTKPQYAYLDSIIYPKSNLHYDVVVYQVGDISIVNFLVIDIKNLPLGTYQYRVTDSCGNEIRDSFVIRLQDLTILNHNTSFKKGCLGQNILYYGFNSINSPQKYILINNLVTGAVIANLSKNGYDNKLDSITSIPSGKYQVSIFYSNGGNQTIINQNITDCWTVRDTLNIPIYQRPQTQSVSIIYCNGNRYAEFHPDSSRGIPPYQYEVITGPRLYPIQSSNVFTFIPVGNYTSRIVDACGNSNILDFGVDTLIFPHIHKVGSSCLNGNVSLFYQSSPFYTYQWTKPDGTIYTGDTLRINNVVYADTGLYQIKRYVNINGCMDTAATSYRLLSNAEYEVVNTICEGEHVSIGTHTYTQSGTYYDTILSAACDTFITLKLTVLPAARRNIVTTLCIGERVFIGNHVYSNSGNYIDTLTAANGCDSIVTLTLTFTQDIQIAITVSKNIVLPMDTVQLHAIALINNPRDAIAPFHWTSIATLNNTTIQNPIATISQPSWIYLDVKSEFGCANRDSVFIDIIDDCNAEGIFIPNSFTPNGDGMNDIFKVRSQNLQFGKLIIYNRWGNKVFESDDLSKGWDGTYKGLPEQEEAYGYYFEGKCLNGESFTKKGNVTLMR